MAGRFAEAFRNIGRGQIAHDIVGTMKAAGYSVQESTPFEAASPIQFGAHETSPYINRLRLSWMTMCEDILKIFPPPPGLAGDISGCLKRIDEIYAWDAYNSLSIKGYKVSAELIEGVRSGNWNPD